MRDIALHNVVFIMELEKLIQQRDAYAGRIIKLAIIIAILFLVPAAIAMLVHYYMDISYMYLFPLAFIISWTGVILLYRKISKEVRALDARIKELRAQEANSSSESTKTELVNK